MKYLSPGLQIMLLGFFVLGQAIPAHSQGDGYLNNSNLRGEVPFGTYQYGEIDNINLGTGTVNLNIPLFARPGRGFSDGLQLTYSSKIWTIHVEYVYCDPETDPLGCEFPQVESFWWKPTANPGARINSPHSGIVEWVEQYHECHTEIGIWMNTKANFTYSSGDGASFRFPNRVLATNGNPANCGWTDVVISKGQSDSGVMELDTSQEPWVIRHKDGTTLTVSTLNGSVTSAKDRNGNIYNSTALWSPAGLRDSNGNPISFPIQGGSTSQTPAFPSQMCGKPAYVVPEYVATITSVTLPNGKVFTLEYDPAFGELTKITLPTGGYIRYQYQTLEDTDNSPFPNVFCYVHSRRVTRRWVSATGQSQDEKEWQYSYVRNGSTDYTTTVIDPAGHKAVYKFSGDGIHQLESTLYEGLTTARMKVVNTWQTTLGTVHLDAQGNQQIEGKDWRIVSTTTTLLDTNQVTKSETVYGTNYTAQYSTENRMNVVETKEYHYGSGAPGALARRTTFSYLHDSNTNYLNRHMWDRVTLKSVYDGSGNLKAQSETKYDTHALTNVTGAIQHDGTNYGTTMNYRGNATESKVWRNTDGAWLTSKSWYNILGNMIQTQDPLGHNTFYDYTDSWEQGTCTPTGGSAFAFVKTTTNHLGHTVTNSYYSCTGLVASTTDPNNRTASFQYEVMDRPTQVTRPDGGWTAHAFDDTNRKVTRTVALDATRTLSAEFVYDGLARVTDTAFLSDPQGVTRSRVEYDAFGRVALAYNPTRCVPVTNNCESTWGTTATVYDGLGRVTKVRPPDGTLNPDANIVATSYSGNTVTVTDQAGKKRKSETDALGRLLRVWEPDAAGALVNVTQYAYDTLDNLTCVVQKGTDTAAFTTCAAAPAGWRPRSFTYNSLSQLLTATNPESGTITYTYDSDGNLLTKTDARAITVSHAYDALHRLNKKTYSDTTPLVRFAFDGVAFETCNTALSTVNAIGRRTAMCDGAGNESWAYNAMGQIVVNRRTTNSVTKDFTYAFNAGGAITSIGYPTGRTIAYTYDSTGRPLSASDGTTTYASAASYAAHGALASVIHGPAAGFGGFTLTHSFNNRLQPSTIVATSPSSTLFDFSYDFVDAGGKNNGNVDAILNNRNHNRDQSFSYDELNRIKTAQSAATTGGDCWGLEYGFDIWANLLNAAVTKCVENALSVMVDTKNRITNSGFSYDSAGNMLNDGSYSYAWDAESRMKSGAGVDYTYDGDGRRVKKDQVGGTAHDRIYSYGMGSDALVESDLAGNVSEEYVFFGGKRVARRNAASGNIFYYFADHLGTSRIMAQANATAACYEADYTPYGKERIITDTCPQNYKFTGKERDGETGNDHFGARHHGSRIGRFLSPDPGNAGAHPAVPQSWNAYSYVANNPLNALDPDGLDYYLIGGDKCGEEIQCDKDGFILDDDGNRIVIKDEDVLNGTNGVHATHDDKTGITTITTAQGTFQGHFFDPNPAYIRVSLTSEQVALMILTDAGERADAGKNAAIALTAPNFIMAGGAQAAFAGEAAIAETTILPSTLNHLIGPFQRELLKQFFRSKGASIPEGLSSESLKLYAEVAKRAIAEGMDDLGVQAMRLKWIADALKRM